MLSFILRETAVEQLAMVRAKQLEYFAGDGPCPLDDIKALQLLHGILKEEAVVANLEIRSDAPVEEKASAIAQATINGLLSPANAERLLGVLQKQLELVEYQQLAETVENLTEELSPR